MEDEQLGRWKTRWKNVGIFLQWTQRKKRTHKRLNKPKQEKTQGRNADRHFLVAHLRSRRKGLHQGLILKILLLPQLMALMLLCHLRLQVRRLLWRMMSSQRQRGHVKTARPFPSPLHAPLSLLHSSTIHQQQEGRVNDARTKFRDAIHPIYSSDFKQTEREHTRMQKTNGTGSTAARRDDSEAATIPATPAKSKPTEISLPGQPHHRPNSTPTKTKCLNLRAPVDLAVALPAFPCRLRRSLLLRSNRPPARRAPPASIGLSSSVVSLNSPPPYGLHC